MELLQAQQDSSQQDLNKDLNKDLNVGSSSSPQQFSEQPSTLEDWLPRVLHFIREIYQDNPLTTVQENVFCRCWLGYTYREIADELSYDRIYVRAIGAQIWQSLSKKLGQRVSKSNFQPLLQQRVAECQTKQRLTVMPVVPRRSDTFQADRLEPSIAEAIGLHVDGLKDYIDRPPLEGRCCEAVLQTGALIRIKAPKQMGKTALVHRILYDASQRHLRTVCLSLKLADTEIFSSLDRFLQWFCAIVEDQLELPSQLEQVWKPIFGSNYNCTNYFARHILTQLQEPLVLALDDVDILFQYPEIAIDFLGLLRAWCEKAKHAPGGDPWQKLRLIVAHSTEVYIPLQHNQSPFNIGLSIELPEFNTKQVIEFAGNHGLPWKIEQAQALMAWIGGKPELVRLALEAIERQRCSVEDFLEQTLETGGVYQEHLRRQFMRLQEYPDLLPAMAQLMSWPEQLAETVPKNPSQGPASNQADAELTSEPMTLDPIQGFRLESLGLVRLQGYKLEPSCQLYRHYFSNILRSSQS